jgi:hypothetical protein
LGIGTSSPAVKLDINGITGWGGGTTGIVGSIVTSVPKVVQTNERAGLNFSGSRVDATQYFIDGVKVIGDPQIPQSGIEEMVVITGGVPAQYGDTTSGVVLITTKQFR